MKTPADKQPVVLGCTGHRDIDSRDSRLCALVREQFEWIASNLGGPIEVCLSSLAEGADRLVAREAMDATGAKLVAPLPMPAGEYMRDFTSPASRKEFRDLLGRAHSDFELHCPPGGDLDRGRQYALAGAWIVRHCRVLIALWDGRPPRGAGGTADVVKWMLRGRVPAEFDAVGRAGPDLPTPPTAQRLVVHIHPRTGVVRRMPSAGSS